VSRWAYKFSQVDKIRVVGELAVRGAVGPPGMPPAGFGPPPRVCDWHGASYRPRNLSHRAGPRRRPPG
jgi:hypothetical protein